MAPVKKERLGTPEAEELADFIERLRPGDLGAVHQGPGARGRPPLTAGAKQHSPTIHVRLPDPLFRTLTRRAHAEGVTVSALVRNAVERAFLDEPTR